MAKATAHDEQSLRRTSDPLASVFAPRRSAIRSAPASARESLEAILARPRGRPARIRATVAELARRDRACRLPAFRHEPGALSRACDATISPILQPTLSSLGLSSLGTLRGPCDGQSRRASRRRCRASAASSGEPFPAAELWSEGERRLAAQRRALFGRENNATAIMVTLPTEAASDAALVETYVAAGCIAPASTARTTTSGRGPPWSRTSGRRPRNSIAIAGS